MSDVGIAYGDPGVGPPLNLPTLDLPPRPRERIRIGPDQAKAQPKADPWAGWTDEGPLSAPVVPQQVQPGAQAAPAGDPWAGWTDQGPNADKQTPPEIGLGEAALMGVRSGLTAGAYPFLKGEAARMGAGPRPGEEYLQFQTTPEAEKMRAGMSKAATETREEQQKREEAAASQHPVGYYGGELGAGIAPALLSGGTTAEAGLGAAIGRGALGGAGYGAASGAGGALSEGKSAEGVAGRAALGAGVGGALGGVGGAIGEGILRGGQVVGRIFRGARDADTEAGRQVAQQLGADVNRFGYPVTPEMDVAAQQAGLPLGLIDLGSQGTRDLGRVAATSSDAWQTFQDFFTQRARLQNERIGGFVRRITGGARAADDREVLEQAATTANNAAYRAAYAAGDRPIASPELDRLLGAPEVVEAVRSAASKGQNFATLEGHGAFRPGVTVTNDGRVVFNRGPSGAPTYPNVQFWDYVQRYLRSAGDKYARAGDRNSARVAEGLRSQLNDEIDRLVPEFGQARMGAARAFASRDAHEAGQNFVGSNLDPDIARRQIARMSAPDRELFARGFASELANRFEGLRYDLNAINRAFVDTPRARQQIIIALGGQRAAQLEALLRVEAVAQQSAGILRGSPTARNLAQYAGHGIAGAGGAGAVAGYEMVHGHDINPVSLLAGALVMGGLRGYAGHIDRQVANRIAEMLVSNDPQVLTAGVRSLVRNRAMFDNLRRATRTGVLTPAMFGARHPAGTTAVGAALTGGGEGEGSAGSENDPYFGTYYGTEKRQ